MNWKQRAIKEYGREVDRLTSYKEVLAHLPDNLPLDVAYALEYCVVGYIPWDQNRYNQIEEMLEQDGWKWAEEHTVRDGSRSVSFTKDDRELRIYMDPTKEGSTCQRVQVGVQEWPVYEVQCAAA